MSTRSRPAPDDQAAALAAELRATFSKLKRRLREHGSHGHLTFSQASVLQRLEADGPSTVSNLARAEGMRPQSMGAIITPLEAAGLVSGAPDPNDGRQTLISLTKACRKWIDKSRAARQDWLTRAIQARLSPQEQQKLASAIELLTRLIED